MIKFITHDESHEITLTSYMTTGGARDPLTTLITFGFGTHASELVLGMGLGSGEEELQGG